MNCRPPNGFSAKLQLTTLLNGTFLTTTSLSVKEFSIFGRDPLLLFPQLRINLFSSLPPVLSNLGLFRQPEAPELVEMLNSSLTNLIQTGETMINPKMNFLPHAFGLKAAVNLSDADRLCVSGRI